MWFAATRSKGVSVFEPQARLAVRDVDDLVGVVPYLIGFHPYESLVVLVLQDGAVVVTARVDVEAAADRGGLAELLRRLFERFPTAEGWFLAYTDDSKAAWALLTCCSELVGEQRLGRLIQVSAAKWRCDHREGPCGSLKTSPAAAHAAWLGLPARSSREELAALVAGPPDADTDALVAAFEAITAELAGLSAVARQQQAERVSQKPESAEDYLRLAILVGDPRVQLALLGQLDRENAARATELWIEVVRHCLVPYLVAPLGLLGVASWLTGDGAMQNICLERLDRIDPLAPIAALLDWINTAVMPPDDWAIRRRGLLAALAEQFTVIDQARS